MRAVIQRVSQAAVKVGAETVGAIGPGLVVLLGVGCDDGEEEVRYIAGKIARLRIFPDEAELMNRSVMDVGGSVLLVSQFTLLASTKKGNRPSFTAAAAPERAEELYEAVAAALGAEGVEVATGSFGAMMEVSLVNDGPVTIVMDSR